MEELLLEEDKGKPAERPFVAPAMTETPKCPNCGLGIHAIRADDRTGEYLFECLSAEVDGYMAVYQSQSGIWRRPLANYYPDDKPWIAPKGSESDLDEVKRMASAGEPLIDISVAPKRRIIEKQPVPVEAEDPKGPEHLDAVTISDAAEILGLNAVELLAKVRAGEVPSVKIDGKTMIPASYFAGGKA